MAESPDKKYDARGLVCPMPIIGAKNEIGKLKSGQVLEILADDEGSLEDFPAWCEQTGNELLSTEIKDGIYRFLIKKK